MSKCMKNIYIFCFLIIIENFFEKILYKQKTVAGAQANELSSSIRSTMLGTAAIEVGAVGLGLTFFFYIFYNNSFES